jgi:hypothetical protein
LSLNVHFSALKLHANCTKIWGKNIAADANWQDEQMGIGIRLVPSPQGLDILDSVRFLTQPQMGVDSVSMVMPGDIGAILKVRVTPGAGPPPADKIIKPWWRGNSYLNSDPSSMCGA